MGASPQVFLTVWLSLLTTDVNILPDEALPQLSNFPPINVLLIIIVIVIIQAIPASSPTH